MQSSKQSPKQNQNLLRGKRALVALSGGYGSFVAAALLKNQGYEVRGIHFDFGMKEKYPSRCTRAPSKNEIEKNCLKLGIPLQTVSLCDEFDNRVVDTYVHGALQHRVPSPCGNCNQLVLESLAKRATELGIEWIVTGHRARLHREGDSKATRLLAANEESQDQSYTLYGTPQAILNKALMPLGDLPDSMIRKLAAEFELGDFNNPPCERFCETDATSIAPLLAERISVTLRPKGMTRNLEGHILGAHEGLYRFVLGQEHRALSVAKDADADVVIGFDTGNQILVVGPREYLLHRELTATEAKWVRPIDELRAFRPKCKFRPDGERVDCEVAVFENQTIHVQFEKNQEGLRAGQAIVFYEGEEVLGGAVIEHVGSTEKTPKK